MWRMVFIYLDSVVSTANSSIDHYFGVYKEKYAWSRKVNTCVA